MVTVGPEGLLLPMVGFQRFLAVGRDLRVKVTIGKHSSQWRYAAAPYHQR
jgi:hypothetical protein